MRVALLLCTVALAGCLADVDDEPLLTDKETVSFIVIGDSGTGGEGQYAVAAAIKDVCQRKECGFALGLGDNIYETGVSDEYDSQFDEKFELPYQELDFPFWMVLGNHDNGGDGLGFEPQNGDHQVAYHYRTDRMSEKWHMPARFYTFTEGDGLVQFFGLDSGPFTVHALPIIPAALTGDQATWLDQELGTSDATWKITFSHHPYVSNGQHGNAGTYDGVMGHGQGWKDLLQDNICGVVDVHFAGHDHDLQWLEAADCPGTQFIISGAAGKTRSVRDADDNAALFQQYDTYGFVWVELTSDTFTAEFYDDAGEMLYGQVQTKA